MKYHSDISSRPSYRRARPLSCIFSLTYVIPAVLQWRAFPQQHSLAVWNCL